MKRHNLFTAVVSVLFLASCSCGNSWAPAGDRIMTRWGEETDPGNVLQEYPRPQMTRDRWENLNGLWEYAVTASDSEPDGMDGQILVPFAIESALSGVGRSIEEDEVLWYERQFSVPKDWNGSRIMLNFGAVDWKAEVYVNGQKAGEHTGGYTPFSFDITDLLARRGRNTLRIKVSDRDRQLVPGSRKTGFGTRWHLVYVGDRNMADGLVGAGTGVTCQELSRTG